MIKEDIKTNIVVNRVIDNELCLNDLYSICIDKNNNRIVINLNYDLYINLFGEFGITTNDNFLCMDSINSNIMLNSRASKHLFNENESIEYRNKLIEEQLNKSICGCDHDNELIELKSKIKDMENEIKILKEYIYGNR